MNLYVGIDPGKNGGIVTINSEGVLKLYPIPKIKTNVDYRELYSIFNAIEGDNIYCVIEEVHSVFGSSAKSNFNFGYISGVLLGMIISREDISYEMVPPKKWQKEIWSSSDIVKKENGRNDTKATSLLAAKRLFPGESFLATPRSKKPHDGLYDAALLAEYCKRKFK